MIRIAMWSGPRNISTALMRSFASRPDCAVYDEPFYAFYLYKTGADHPLRDEIIKSGNTNWQSVSDEIIGPIPDDKNIWYQKHMAQHNLPGCDLSWINNLTNCILIRHPKDVILSYTKKFELCSIDQLGYHQQGAIYNILKNEGKAPLVLDVEDILKDPKHMLKAVCNKLEIPFYNEMLHWQSGSRKSDGIWGRHWYQNVKASTGFRPYKKKIKKLSNKYKEIYLDCLDWYEKLYEERFCY